MPPREPRISRRAAALVPVSALVLVATLGSGGCVADLFSGNRAPKPVDSIPPIEVLLGGTWSRDVSPFFRDPDSDALTFTAAGAPPDVVAVFVSGSMVRVSAKRVGEGVVVVRAWDPDGRTAKQSASVRVRGFGVLTSPPPPPPTPDMNSP